MPQIQVNEIDQSVVTRVVSDDKAKILVPIISSFGPAFDGDNTSVSTFTDITDFNRMYGYTEAEFNPIDYDYSRTYAAQLIQKGAAVSVVRVNNAGPQAVFDINGTNPDRTVPGKDTVCPAVAVDMPKTQVTKEITEAPTTTHDGIVPGTVTITVSDVMYTDVPGDPATTGTITIDASHVGTITYETGAIVWSIAPATGVTAISYTYNDYVKATFCPQIQSITAKYTGSFGNRLMIAISQINTANVTQSYQYANISVYYANVLTSYDYDPVTGTYTDKTVINGATLLETKRVSTNPDDPYYFEDVEFEFITIKGTPSAREELRLVWSNINGQPEANTTPYAGFPVIKLKYNNNGAVYNKEARLKGGADFNYSPELLEKLRTGFKGYYTSDNKWSAFDVVEYINEVYGENGIANNLYASIENVYKNFTDPYIYDFDFITSGGFVYYKYTAASIINSYDGKTVTATQTDEAVTITSETATLAKKSAKAGTVRLSATGEDTTYYKDVPDDSDPYTGKIMETDSTYGDPTSTTVYGTIDYSTGKITGCTITGTVTASYTYYTGTVPKVSPAIPVTSGSDTYDAMYTEVNPIHAAMRDLVQTRQDCIALFDVPFDYDKDEIVEYSRMLNTSYGTIHHPWCWVQHPTIGYKEIRMAPSYIFLYTFLSNLIDNVDAQKWFPPAGVKRATARVVKRPDYEIGSVILNKWQNDDPSRVNPIMRLKQYGYVIYGQYTTLQAIDLYTHSALESLNVRLISNVVKKKIFDTCLNMAFEPNTATLWLKFYAQLDPFLRYMKYNEGVYDYKIKMDQDTVTTDDINHLRCPGKVWIAPTRTAEYFDVDFILTEAGAIFPED